MESDGDQDAVEVQTMTNGFRKKRISGGKRAAMKKARYSAPRASLYLPCQHNTKQFQCCKVTPNDVKTFRNDFYKKPIKLRQDSIISSLILTNSVKRRRPRPLQSNKKNKAGTEHAYNTKFYLLSGENKVPVCKKLFMAVTRIKRTRLMHIIKAVFSGKAIEEHRGGDRVSYKSRERKNSVRTFIGKLKGTESHYNRQKSKRIYLGCEYSISKLHKIYNSKCLENLKVKCSMFRLIFVSEFNIGFKSPASDVCSYCTLLTNQIKRATTNSSEKTSKMAEKRIHKIRAKAFYKHLKADVPDSKTLCFDLQQIQPLPKTQIQEAFYARQIGFYALCIADTATNKADFYTWTEEQAGKGSAEISSALLQHLEKLDLMNIKLLRLFSDGCIAQNKNNIVIRTLLHFLRNQPELEIIFITPVRGHSYLPADRIFGRVEKLLRKKQTILTKNEYYEIYKQVGTVHILGKDWVILDIKSLSQVYKDLPMISETKKIHLKPGPGPTNSVVVKGSKYFNYEDETETYISLVKRGVKQHRTQLFKLKELPLSHEITKEKKEDVDKLLKNMFGEWQTLDESSFGWYKEILFNTPTAACTPTETEEIICDCLDTETSVHI